MSIFGRTAANRYPLIWKRGRNKALVMVDTAPNLSRHAKAAGWRFVPDKTKFGGHWVDPSNRDIYYMDEMQAIRHLRGPEKAKGWRPDKYEN